jgi:diketogulonate reductase-like aldo/keto reductase
MTIASITLPGGESIPQLGQGTWRMGEVGSRRREEIRALQLGIELGMTLIDTAEMYADGEAESVTGEAIAGRRDAVFLVSKVLPSHASLQQTISACEQSLKRLGTEVIDLYLLHWRGGYGLDDTLSGFEALQRAGKIRHWGVSNFDVDDMEELFELGGTGVATNQVLYNLTRRGVEHDLMPWQAERGIPVMAYSPIEQGRLAGHRALGEVARRHGKTEAQIALAFVLNRSGVIAIPKATSESHVRDNRAAADIVLTPEDFAALDASFPPPTNRVPLEMI